MALSDQAAENVLGPVSGLLLEESSSEVQAACLDLLEKLGALASLSNVRTDGWFQKIGEEINNFREVCDVMGEQFLAYSIILGVRIHRLITDPNVAANTTVEFTLVDDQPQTLTLGEFRVRIVQALIHYHAPVSPVSLPLDDETAADLIGEHNLLLASYFGFSLEQLILSNLDPEEPHAVMGYISEGGFNFIDLRDFNDLLKQRIRRDLSGVSEEPFRLDLRAVERAKKAYEKKDFDGVISALEIWPGLLSILQRTPVVQQLDQMQKDTIGEGLELLGSAFLERGRETWALELFRLGLQFVREGLTAGRLFFRLATLMESEDRYGEMIGLLRRAMSLGVSEEKALPLLGRAFLRRNMVVAAAAILEDAVVRGFTSATLETDLSEVRQILKLADVSWSPSKLN